MRVFYLEGAANVSENWGSPLENPHPSASSEEDDTATVVGPDGGGTKWAVVISTKKKAIIGEQG